MGAAANYLKQINYSAYELLTTVPVRFHRQQKEFISIVDSPMLRFDGDKFMVRYSYFTLAPFKMPFERMEAWYAAYDQFARIVRTPEHQYRTLLQPGDVLLYENHRMMHGRTGFTGGRWLRGIYYEPK
eukprot:NODE_5382_length_581_cov_45.118421_g4668_i0.p1 GENE.NODE_5382_length_581_cov_45.118421_g4668_i0~~NODE_5382_length_581_cov_45.118421_g4668_i0.p1  ORF type:complete len:138 (-),score=42.97 NODE_5382_length_581_cov_45.118421_g4668_i0:166-549(-)